MASKGKTLDRRGKVKSRTPRPHAVGESDNPIVPLKQANEGPQPRLWRGHRPEESEQGRGLAEGNAKQWPIPGTQSPDKRMSCGLLGVREAARRDKDLKFTALLHHIDVWNLEDSFYQLKREAAPGGTE